MGRLKEIGNSYRLDWLAAMWAGIAAGLLFLVAQMGMVALFTEQSIWLPTRWTGALVLGEEALFSEEFDPVAAGLTLVVHFSFSIGYGLIIGVLIARRSLFGALFIGVLAGGAIYFISFYALPLLVPWLVAGRGWINLVSYLLFGLATAWVYVEISAWEPERGSGNPH